MQQVDARRLGVRLGCHGLGVVDERNPAPPGMVEAL